jgi:cAMP phosphodiesterase
MKIRVLGCAGAEFPGSNSPAFLLDDETLFDAGSLTNVLDEKAQHRIRNIFITHAHLDHIRSIPFLADNIIVGGSGQRITLLSIAPVIETIKRHLFNSSVWPDFTEIPDLGKAILNLVPLRAGYSISINSYIVTPYSVNHTVPAVGYLVESRRGRRFFYTGDTGPTPDTWKEIGVRKIDCLIIDVSFPNRLQDLALRSGHLTPKLLKAELTEMPSPPVRVFVTHPKPQHLREIRREIESLGLSSIEVLEDGQVITV